MRWNLPAWMTRWVIHAGHLLWERATVASLAVRTMQKRVKIISTLLICNTTSLYSSFGQILGRGATKMILRAPIASAEGLSGPFRAFLDIYIMKNFDCLCHLQNAQCSALWEEGKKNVMAQQCLLSLDMFHSFLSFTKVQCPDTRLLLPPLYITM